MTLELLRILHQILIIYFLSVCFTTNKTSSQTNTAMNKVFLREFKSFIANDKPYHFMNTNKGTAAYWK